MSTPAWALVTGATTQPVSSSVTTRAYRRPEGEWLRGVWLMADVQTWNPSTTYSLVAEGVAEETALATGRTKSRSAYYRPWAATAWSTDNANDDHDTPYREDYSVAVGGDQVTQFYVGTGVQLDAHQENTERFHVVANGSRAVQVRVANSRGRLRLMGLRLDTQHKPINGSSNS